MSSDMKKLNKQLDILQHELIRQLNSTNIEYIDLLAFYNQVNNIKILKNSLVLKECLY